MRTTHRSAGLWLRRCIVRLGTAGALWVFLAVLGPLHAGDQPHDPRTWVPPTVAGADNHHRVPFLDPERSWERIDLWVPKGAGPHPCVVVFYGGGYGEKVVPRDAISHLVEAGYAVALPDYSLGATSPEPLAQWDGAAAIRWLRSRAKDLRIDPTRIGAWGFSAGGWLVQRLAPADALSAVSVRRPINRNGDRHHAWLPILDPHPSNPDQPVRLQAVVTDWGAGNLAQADVAPLLDPSDPPLLTCHNAGPGIEPPGLVAYRKAGAPGWLVSLEVANTHVPDAKTKGVMDGAATTWYGAVRSYFDRTLRTPPRATPPEAYPAGGPLAGPAEIRLLAVHGRDSVRFTLDGSEPGPASGRLPAAGTVRVAPGQTLRAVSLVDGMAASPVITAAFTAGPPVPRITTPERRFRVAAGAPFSLPFTVAGGERSTGPWAAMCLSTGPPTRRYRGSASTSIPVPASCPARRWPEAIRSSSPPTPATGGRRPGMPSSSSSLRSDHHASRPCASRGPWCSAPHGR
jgi:hypothetical protein